MLHHVIAQSTVTDLSRAEEWYTTLFDRAPDTRPMPGLIEWYLSDGSGLQVWSEADRAGQSAAVLGETDLDAAATRLAGAGFEHEGPQPGGGARILLLTDPDGNRVVLSGP
ncbi:MAG TPA: VOC family protein [Candidatus Ruania gallistercoris]|uniref:VOC family protein n=1 Tax=Candidatus Ruania gallistercoris TaxID=2838746 RepID=A0A9D2EHA5_9MICO|nr:VOC family protein [Candidatus Ruania gallistercoris]